MDVRREPKGPGRKLFAGLLALFLLVAVTVVLGRLQPASPAVDGDLIVTATVQRGTLPLEIRGWGEFAPDQVQGVEATVSGRVASIHVEPGEIVQAGSPLIELASPDLALEAARAEQEFTAAKAAFSALRRSIGTQRLERESALLDHRAELARINRSIDRLEELLARGEVPERELVAAVESAATVEEQIRVEEEMLTLLKETGDEQVLLEKEKLLALAEVLHRERERLSALKVAAPGKAVVESVQVGPGDWVSPGTGLVRLVRPERLRADLKVPLPGATKVREGNAVLLVDAVGDSTGGAVLKIGEPVPGKDGKYMQVRVKLDRPPGMDATADAGVDAVIRLGFLENTLFVKRPAWAGDDGLSTVFRVSRDGESAEQVQVKFGVGSWDRVQVLEGLGEGDEIIISDMSAYDAAECIRIK
jgi:multidrug efflux pump subunit AcrA (membrane-fusion protein)